MNSKLSIVLFAQIALLGAGGCASDQTDEQDLQALLHDEPLKQVFPGASSVAPEPGAVDGRRHSNIVLPSANPVGVWDFEDCNSARTNLSDSTFNGNTAFRSVGVTCTDGIRNSRAVSIAIPEDIVYVPDQPSFTFGGGVTVAGWFRPAALGGTKTLFRKRDKDTSSFALLLDAGKFTFVVNLGDGHAISVIAPKKAKAGVYQHVAATYDGMVARLYIDGAEVNNFPIAGAIPPGPGPLLMGNDGSERRYNGSFDSTLFATHALTAAEVAALTCFPVAPSISVSPSNQPVPAGGTGTFDIALTNNNSASCAPLVFSLEPESFDSRVVTNPPSFTTVQSAPVPSGTTGHFTVTASPSVDIEPNTFIFIDFLISEPVTNTFSFQFGSLTVTEPVGCHISTPRELMIKSTTVVDDPIRTVFNPSSTDARNGVWTFKHLVENMAPTPEQAPAMVEAILNSFTTPQTINGFTVDARPGMQPLVLAFWPRTADGALDLARAPLRLQAIVNRFDLRDLGNGDAGEGRFVFAFNDPFSSFFPLQATMIFEYKLPATTDQDVLDWAQRFHGLGAMQFGESYNAALQQITERFVARGARPDHPNGSAINAVRTNEIAFASQALWELREFHLSASSGLLEPSPVALTPDRSFNFTDTLGSFINANQDAIIAEKHVVPEQLNGAPFQAGAIFNDLGTWFAPGTSSEARHHFALNTCNGCHSSDETNVTFLQISPRTAGSEAFLSPFLTGTTVVDRASGQTRTFNDLARRNADLNAIVCTDGAALAGAGANGTTLRKGISRVH